MSTSTIVPARWLSIDDAVAISGIPPAELVTHLELFRPDKNNGEVRVDRRALDRYVRARSAQEAMNGSASYRSGVQGGGKLPQPSSPSREGGKTAQASPVSASELARKLEGLARLDRATSRALFAIDTARSILVLEKLRRRLQREHDPEAVMLVSRAAFRLRMSLAVSS